MTGKIQVTTEDNNDRASSDAGFTKTNDNQEGTPLTVACQQGKLEDVKEILKTKINSTRERTRNGKLPLHFCAEAGSASCLDLILTADPSFINAQDEEGYTPLHYGVINGKMDIVQKLIAAGGDLNCVDNENHSLVHWATVCGEVEILDTLLSAGSSPSVPDFHLAHPIHYAAQMCGSANNANNGGGSGCISSRIQSSMYSVSPKKGLQILKRLIQAGCSVDVRDQDGRVPLLWAASAGSADAILVLVNAGGKVDAEDRDGLTALHCAAARGHTGSLETLIALCGSEVDTIDNNGCTALFYSTTLGHADCTELLLNYGANPNRQDRKGRTPAHCGAAKGQLETLKLLAKHGANLWIRNVRGDLPLHEAVLSMRKDLVVWLLSLFPQSVNTPNNNTRAPLHLAAMSGSIDVLKILIDNGADVNLLMRSGKGNVMTPLDAALVKGNNGAAKYIQMHGGIPSNSLNDAALQRRIMSVAEGKVSPALSMPGSYLGPDPSPGPDGQRNFVSPDMLDVSQTSRHTAGLSPRFSTPTVEDGVQTEKFQGADEAQGTEQVENSALNRSMEKSNPNFDLDDETSNSELISSNKHINQPKLKDGDMNSRRSTPMTPKSKAVLISRDSEEEDASDQTDGPRGNDDIVGTEKNVKREKHKGNQDAGVPVNSLLPEKSVLSTEVERKRNTSTQKDDVITMSTATEGSKEEKEQASNPLSGEAVSKSSRKENISPPSPNVDNGVQSRERTVSIDCAINPPNFVQNYEQRQVSPSTRNVCNKTAGHKNTEFQTISGDYDDEIELGKAINIQEAAFQRKEVIRKRNMSQSCSTPATPNITPLVPHLRSENHSSEEQEIRLQEALLASSGKLIGSDGRVKPSGKRTVSLRKSKDLPHKRRSSARRNGTSSNKSPALDSGFVTTTTTTSEDVKTRLSPQSRLYIHHQSKRRIDSILNSAGSQKSVSNAGTRHRKSIFSSSPKQYRTLPQRSDRVDLIIRQKSYESRPGKEGEEDDDLSSSTRGSFTSEEAVVGTREKRTQRRKNATNISSLSRPRSKLTFSRNEDYPSQSPNKAKPASVNVETPISVTQAMQASMRKYNLERMIFHELLELKRLQLSKAAAANEHLFVRRIAENYKKAGYSVNFKDFEGPFTFRSFEKYLYGQLRLLQSNRKVFPRFAPSDDIEKLSKTLRKMTSGKLPYLEDAERSESACENIQCTHTTHRCHHAYHAYTGVPCAAYIGTGKKSGFLPKVNPLKAPGPTQKDGKTRLTVATAEDPNRNPLKISISPRRTDTESPITLEVQQGVSTKVFTLPTKTLDPAKDYYVSLSIKPNLTSLPSPSPSSRMKSTNFQYQRPPEVTDDGSFSAPPADLDYDPSGYVDCKDHLSI